MRRTALRRGTKPLHRSTRLRARGNTKYRRRERDFPFMGWVKQQRCLVSLLLPWMFVSPTDPGRAIAARHKQTPCSGPIEADHMGSRGIGQKAADNTCAPICQGHHSERHAHAGTFFHMTRDELRLWRAEAISRTQAAWSNR
jgi:hypothetical protein